MRTMLARQARPRTHLVAQHSKDPTIHSFHEFIHSRPRAQTGPEPRDLRRGNTELWMNPCCRGQFSTGRARRSEKGWCTNEIPSTAVRATPIFPPVSWGL